MQLYTGAPSPSMSMTSAGGGSPMAADADAESPRAAHARHLLTQRPPGARQRLGFQTVTVADGALQRPPSPGIGQSRVRSSELAPCLRLRVRLKHLHPILTSLQEVPACIGPYRCSCACLAQPCRVAARLPG